MSVEVAAVVVWRWAQYRGGGGIGETVMVRMPLPGCGSVGRRGTIP